MIMICRAKFFHRCKLTALALGFLVGIVYIVALCFSGEIIFAPVNMEKSSYFGSFFAGVVGSFWSLAAVFIYAETLESSSFQHGVSRSQASRQHFESTLLNLVAQHTKISNSKDNIFFDHESIINDVRSLHERDNVDGRWPMFRPLLDEKVSSTPWFRSICSILDYINDYYGDANNFDRSGLNYSDLFLTYLMPWEHELLFVCLRTIDSFKERFEQSKGRLVASYVFADYRPWIRGYEKFVQ